MKLTVFFLLVALIQVSASVYSQQTKLSLSLKDVTVREVLKTIEDQSEFFFLYKNENINVNRIVNVDIKEKSVEDLLDQIFKGTTVSYEVINRQIVLVDKEKGDFFSPTQQQKPISGKVTDSANSPLPGVSVVVKGTTNGTITDAEGSYTLANVPGNATLLFSFVGMKTQEAAVSGKSSINVVLVEDAIGLEEVVAVGYGTQKKVNLTGSVSTVKGDELTKRTTSNAGALLQGMMPGVQIVQNSGQPGNEGVTINIRGAGTYSQAGSNPLVLVDGVQGDLNLLDPATIESVSVLKDAASCAIYGSRAANGVILVTTKSGGQGKLQIEYSGNYAINTPTRLFDLITNSADYMTMWNTARINTFGANTDGLYSQSEIDAYKNATDRNKFPNFDWQNAAIKAEPTQTHNLSINGTVGKTRYNVALGYLDQTGTIIGNSFKRYTGRVNLSSQVNDKIKFGTNISFRKADRISGDDQFASIMAQAPTYSPQLSDGSGRYSYKAYSMEYNNKNPFAIADLEPTNFLDYNVTSQLWAEVTLAKGFTWYSKYAYNVDFTRQNSFGSSIPLYNFQTNSATPMATLDLGVIPKGEFEKYSLNAYSNLYSYLNYEKSLGDHFIKLQAGYSQEYNKNNFIQAGRTQYVSTAAKELNAGSNAIMNNDGNAYEWSLRSLFGRLDYSYKNRYLLEANMRYDGSSRFMSGPKTRWGVFPSFSAGWRVTEESFVKDLGLTWLDNLKIRGSYGQLGNQNINNSRNAPYPYQPMLTLTGNYAFDNQNLSAGIAQTALNNQNIKWETTTITDFGFDLGVIKNLNVTFDWYDKKTTDILRQSQLTYLVGLDAPVVNIGAMENKGVELGITYNNTIQSGSLKGLSYFAGANFEHYTNKLVTFGAKEVNSNGYQLFQEGLDYNSFYLLNWIGIFQTPEEVKNSPKQYADDTKPGDLKYADVSGPDGKPDGKVDDYDRTPIKGMYPKLNYSFNLGGSWKGFDISVRLQGVYGIKQYAQWWGVIPFDQGAAPTTDWYNAWTPENHSTTMPRLYWGQNAPSVITRHSTWYLHDASYFRLKNLTIGYTIPAHLTKQAGIDKLRVFFSGDNLFTATKFPGLDPERPVGSQQYAVYPQNKIVAFGVNVNF